MQHIKTFSPKELADLIGVSESSIKRWGDAGLIEVLRTAGGHRRIVMGEALRFIRTQKMRILRPDLLGLPDLENLPAEAATGELTAESLAALLQSEDAGQARGLIAAAFLSGTSAAELFDGPVSGALTHLGRLWHDGENGIYREHVATSLCIEAVSQVRLLIPPPPTGTRAALGGAPPGDPYLLPSLMADTVLSDAGYATVNLGPHTPPAAFHHAVEAHTPDLVWLSATAPLTPDARAALRRDLLDPLRRQGIAVVIGGQDVEAAPDAWPEDVHWMTSMTDLETFATDRLATAG